MKAEVIITLDLIFFCLISIVSGCDEGSVALNESRHEGRVQVCVMNSWRLACGDYGWGENEAKVVCKQLGFTSGSSTSIRHGLLDNEHYSTWTCSGSENCLCNCAVSQQDDCKNSTAHVSCEMVTATKKMEVITPTTTLESLPLSQTTKILKTLTVVPSSPSTPPIMTVESPVVPSSSSTPIMTVESPPPQTTKILKTLTVVPSSPCTPPRKQDNSYPVEAVIFLTVGLALTAINAGIISVLVIILCLKRKTKRIANARHRSDAAVTYDNPVIREVLHTSGTAAKEADTCLKNPNYESAERAAGEYEVAMECTGRTSSFLDSVKFDDEIYCTIIS